MYNEQIEQLISAALADGTLTEKEKQILFKKAQSIGIDLDEFEMVLDARLVELQKAEKEKAEKAAPKSTKYGDVRKCPVCGALVPALTGVCPECGYEFSGVDSNLSSQKLMEALVTVEKECSEQEKKECENIKVTSWEEDKRKKEISEAKSKIASKYEALCIKRKQTIIEMFPIPSTKSDLFEFLTSLQPKILDIDDKLSTSYKKKYQECLNKVKALYSNDEKLMTFVYDFHAIEKEIQKKKIKRWGLMSLGCLIPIALILLFIIAGTISDEIDRHKRNKYMSKMEEIIQSGNNEDILSLVKNAPYGYTYSIEFIKELVNLGHLDAAIYFYKNKVESKNAATEKILYNALINVNRMDEAWDFHELKYKYDADRTYAGNAESYYQYCCDVINYYCEHNDKKAARQFLTQHIVWFEKYVDNAEYGEKYPDFYSTKVRKRLTNKINNY